MAVRWPDGSFTGSVRVGKNPPASVVVEAVSENKKPEEGSTKEVKDADR